MNRRVLYIVGSMILMSFCPSLQGYSQILSEQVNVVRKVLEERGDTMHMELDVKIIAGSVTKNQSWTIIPEITTENNEFVHRFKPVQVNGNNKRQMRHRLKKLNYAEWEKIDEYATIDIQENTDTLVQYIVDIPYEEWFDSARLNFRQVLTLCDNSTQIYLVSAGSSVKLQTREPYQVQPQVSFVMPEKEQKQRKMQGQAYLDFQVGRSVIIPTFRRNPEELAKIDDAFQKVQSDKDVNIIGIFIEGYASPEGKYTTNDKLSHNRADALRKYISGKFGLADNMFKVSSGAEDWDGLKALLEESTLTGKERVLGIINNESDYDSRERKIKALSGGVPYRTMLREMFPQLRRVEYQIDFTVKDYTPEEAKILINKNPEYLSQRELFLVAETFEKGSEDFNNMFDMISRYYPEDKVANVNSAAVMISRGEINAAKRYLDKAGEDIRAFNNLGVYYMLIGELDAAEELFKKSMVLGTKEAEHNLEEVVKKREDNKKMERYNRKK